MKNILRIIFSFLIILAFGTGCKSQASSSEGDGAVRDIFAGVSNVFILKTDNTLWGAGYNRLNQLGIGNNAVTALTCITDETGTPLKDIKSVAAGENHTVILKNDGTLWGAGNSPQGELGQSMANFRTFNQLKAGDTLLSGVKEVASGPNSTLFIYDDNSLWVSGFNYYGELGFRDRSNLSFFAKTESAGQNVKAIAAGLRHTVVLKDDGTLWVSGYNSNGQLGLGDTDDRNYFSEVKDTGSGIVAVAAGNYHTVILMNDGSAWAAGSNYWGQLGLKESGDKLRFTRLSDENGNSLTGVREIAARGDLTVLVKNDGSMLLAGNYTEHDDGNIPDYSAAVKQSGSSGDNQEDKPGFAPLVPEKGAASQFKDVKKVVLGYSSIYVLTTDGRLWAAGSNRYGQLNLDIDTESSPELIPIDI